MLVTAFSRQKCLANALTIYLHLHTLKNKNQLDATYYFTVLLIGSTFFLTHGSVHHNSMLIKIQPDATVCSK